MDRPAASTSQMGRFETEWLASETNLTALSSIPAVWIDRVHARRPPVIARYREFGLPLWFRGDAAFARPELYELLEAEAVGYAIRLPAIRVLQERMGHVLTRPVGRPPNRPQVFFASFSYRAQSWTRPRRVMTIDGYLTGEVRA